MAPPFEGIDAPTDQILGEAESTLSYDSYPS